MSSRIFQFFNQRTNRASSRVFPESLYVTSVSTSLSTTTASPNTMPTESRDTDESIDSNPGHIDSMVVSLQSSISSFSAWNHKDVEVVEGLINSLIDALKSGSLDLKSCGKELRDGVLDAALRCVSFEHESKPKDRIPSISTVQSSQDIIIENLIRARAVCSHESSLSLDVTTNFEKLRDETTLSIYETFGRLCCDSLVW